MKRKFILSACLLLALSLAACSDPFGASAKAGADIATGIAQGFSTLTTLEQQGEISPAEALNVAGYLEFANKADEAFLTCAQAAHTAGSQTGAFTACATTFNAALNSPSELALIHISNASASQTVSTIVNGITTGLATLEAELGGK